MYYFHQASKTISSSSGGYSDTGMPIRDTFVALTPGFHFQHAVFYEPVIPCDKSRIGIVIFHSDNDYSTWDIGGELAKRGYRVLAGRITSPEFTLDEKMIDINRAVEFLRNYPGIEKVVLMGHSGGATLMTAYQRAAENGISSLQNSSLLYPCTLKEELTPADGMMILDSNWGNGSMTLLSIDPAIAETNEGLTLNPSFDIFSPENGFHPDGSAYSADFLKDYFREQAERNNKIIDLALERLHAVETGKSFYVDDEPFIVPGGSQIGPCNKLIPQDLHLLSHTKGTHNLIHADGSITNEIIKSVRPVKHKQNLSRHYSLATLQTSVRGFLSERAVYALPSYSIMDDSVTGINWNTTYNCPPGNIAHIHAPLLCMGMTGGYEYLAAEEIYNNAASTDKTLAFVEGATHAFLPETATEAYPGQYGDTRKQLYDFADKWLSKKDRF